MFFHQTEAASFTVDSDTQITVTAPAGTGGGQVVVVTPIGSSENSPPGGDSYAYEGAPVVQSFSPATGSTAGGTMVSIDGSGFTGATAVSFGSTPATSFTVLENSLIFAYAPAHSPGAVPITVTAPGGSTTTVLEYYYVTPLAVTGVSPASGPTAGGNTVTITGSGFTNAYLVNFGSVAASNFTVNSDIDGTVTATSPAGITFCGVTEHGALSVTGPTQGPVILGGTLADGTACAADTIPSAVTVTGVTSPVTVTGLNQNGTLTLENNSDGVTLGGSQVNGLVYFENNTSPLTAGIMVTGNTVIGSLYCTGNDPAPLDYGNINTVSGTASGQCAPIATR